MTAHERSTFPFAPIRAERLPCDVALASGGGGPGESVAGSARPSCRHPVSRGRPDNSRWQVFRLGRPLLGLSGGGFRLPVRLEAGQWHRNPRCGPLRRRVRGGIEPHFPFHPCNGWFALASKRYTDTIDVCTIPSTMRAAQVSAIFVAFMLVSPLAAQQKQRNKPTQPVAELKPALRRDESNSRDWTLHAEVRLHPTLARGIDRRTLPASPQLILKSVEFLYPILDSSAMHEVYPSRLKGEFRIDNILADQEPDIRDGYQSLSSIGVWKAGPMRTHSLVFIADIPMTCWETRIDEAAARRYEWTSAAWSAEMALCLEPQLFVEPKDAAVADLVKKWTKGDPRAMKPYDLAKRLAAGVIEHMRVTDPPTASQGQHVGLGRVAVPFLEGFAVHGAAFAAREKKGSEFDLACLLAAVYRSAGLPSRLVIGYDVKRSDERQGIVLRSWVEFFLAREPAPAAAGAKPAITSKDGEWIPVDITRQWEFSSRAPAQNLKWEYFGNNEEFDFVVPIAFHWLPPEDCTNSGPPGMWGWRPSPVNPLCDAEIKIWASETPRKGGEDPRPRK